MTHLFILTRKAAVPVTEFLHRSKRSWTPLIHERYTTTNYTELHRLITKFRKNAPPHYTYDILQLRATPLSLAQALEHYRLRHILSINGCLLTPLGNATLRIHKATPQQVNLLENAGWRLLIDDNDTTTL